MEIKKFVKRDFGFTLPGNYAHTIHTRKIEREPEQVYDKNLNIVLFTFA